MLRGGMAQKISLRPLQTPAGPVLFYRVVPFATRLRQAGLISAVSLQGRFGSCVLYRPFFPPRSGRGAVLCCPQYGGSRRSRGCQTRARPCNVPHPIPSASSLCAWAARVPLCCPGGGRRAAAGTSRDAPGRRGDAEGSGFALGGGAGQRYQGLIVPRQHRAICGELTLSLELIHVRGGFLARLSCPCLSLGRGLVLLPVSPLRRAGAAVPPDFTWHLQPSHAGHAGNIFTEMTLFAAAVIDLIPQREERGRSREAENPCVAESLLGSQLKRN